MDPCSGAQELPVNYPNTSSVGAENNSVNSNRWENNSHRSIGSYTTTHGSTIQDNNNSSTQAVDGSSLSIQEREVICYPYRYNAYDYTNNIQSINSELNQVCYI